MDMTHKPRIEQVILNLKQLVYMIISLDILQSAAEILKSNDKYMLLMGFFSPTIPSFSWFSLTSNSKKQYVHHSVY